MTAWAIQIIGYGLLAATVTRLAWRSPLGVVGLALCLCAFVSNITYFGASFGTRLTVEVIQCLVIGQAAKVAFSVDHSRCAIGVIVMAIADLAFCATIPFTSWSPKWQSIHFGNVTNVIFALMCFCVGLPSVINAVVGSRRRRAAGRVVAHQARAVDARDSGELP